MKKPLLSAIVFLLVATTSNSQVLSPWTVKDPPLSGWASSPSGIFPRPDGGALVVTVSGFLPFGGSVQGFGNYRLVDVSANGVVRWQKTLGSGWSFQALADNGDLYVSTKISSNQDRIAVLDPDGHILRSWLISGVAGFNTFRTLHIALGNNGEVVTTGAGSPSTSSPPKNWARAYSTTGALLWEWDSVAFGSYGTPGNGAPLGAYQAVNGDWVIYGKSDDFPEFYPNHAQIHVLDSAGNFRWHTFLSTAGLWDQVAAAMPLPGGDILVLVDGTDLVTFKVVRLTSAGAIVYQFDSGVSIPGTFERGLALALAPDGSFVVAGSEAVSQTADHTPILFRFDAAGTFLGSVVPSVVLPGTPGSYLDVAYTPGGTFVATGWNRIFGYDGITSCLNGDGSESWNVRHGGLAVNGHADVMNRGGNLNVGVALDPQGNALVTSLAPMSPSYGMQLQKFISGDFIGGSYCGPANPNSTGQGAELSAFGSLSVLANNAVLLAENLPADHIGFAVCSRVQGFVAFPGGSQGNLCLGGAIGRLNRTHQIILSSSAGSSSVQLDLDNIPQPTGTVPGLIGETWNFQYWFRDDNQTLTSNFTDAITLTFQ